MGSEGEAANPTAKPEVLLWHDLVHESQDLSRLCFWRLSFSPSYKEDEIFKRLLKVFKEVEITSYTIYETLGDYDLLLRVWIPRELGPEEVGSKLEAVLEGLTMWNIDYLSCHTALHWAEVETQLAEWPEMGDRAIAEVSEFNHRQFEQKELIPRPPAVEKLIEGGVLKVVPIDTRGIRFFIVFDHPRHPFNPRTRRSALTTIKKTCAEVIIDDWGQRDLDGVAPPQASIYEGSGTMTEFLIMVRAPHAHFHAFVRDLVLALRSSGLDDSFDIRPYTHVIADRMFSRFAEDRPASGDRRIDVEQDENESLEYKATFGLNVRALIETGEQGVDPRMTHAVVRAICGLLNSPHEGELVIGVLETRRMLERTKDKLGLLTQLRDHFKYEIDPKELVDPPNAVIGINVEIGEGKNFSDLDVYRQRITEVLRDYIKPNPWPFLNMEIREDAGQPLCVVKVKPGGVWFYAKSLEGKEGEFYVREAGSTRAYTGAEADLYKKAYPRD
jgi:hypothetical protein